MSDLQSATTEGVSDHQPATTDPTPRDQANSGPRWPRTGHGDPYRVWILGVGSPVAVSGSREERLDAIAELQRGYVERDQLHAAGILDGAIARLIAAGRLVRRYQGVYQVRPAIELPLGAETAALLAAGPKSVLSHASAASVWKLCAGDRGPVDVTVVRDRHRKTPGIRWHRSGCLRRRDVRIKHGLPVTSPPRTLLDRAATLSVHDLERELDEALVVLRIVRPAEIEDVVTRATGHRGAPILRALVKRRTHETITRSEAERLFLALVRNAGLPEPAAQVRIGDYVVDFLWPEQRVVFEIDSFTFHTSRRAFARDRSKDQALKQARYDPNRVTRDQVKFQPMVVLASVATALARA